MFRISSPWIHSLASGQDGFSKNLLIFLDVSWPPRKGWLSNLVGREVTDEFRLQAEEIAERCREKRRLRESRIKPARKEKNVRKAEKRRARFKVPNDGIDRSEWRKQSEAFYRSDAWRTLRYQALQVCGGKCQCCGASKADGKVMHVDHVKPRYIYPKLALDPANLQVLCDDCNVGKGAWDDTDWRTEEQRLQLQHLRNL